MPSIIAGRLDDLPSDIHHRLGTFRHKVFVQRLHWEIPGVPHDATGEWDEFDAGSTVHLVALSADDAVCGCARLMPTTGPYLLRNVFPELAGPGCLPSSPSIWEMSRFAGSRLPDHRADSTSGMSLFPYAMALALSFGAISVIGVVSNPIARLYRRFGLDLRNIGAGMAPGPADIVACSIDLGPGTFHRLRCDPVMLLDSITRFGQLPLPQAGRPDHASGEAPPIVCGRATVSMRATI
ncbi:acyl-homoserine-lactone synthase [Paraburkholderia phenazinium]|uniref:acyl-homoserine-lactone synthase n=1 Tax=Paraburkholderia phenazinium TaxID=60549 RepID=UPI00158969EF|nr:acyl-homoserine-lactone synthase [Paraburkholderia phenazinium]